MILKNKKITKIGGSRGFIIDAAYFKNKQIFDDKLYDLTIDPSSKEGGGTTPSVTKGKDRHIKRSSDTPTKYLLTPNSGASHLEPMKRIKPFIGDEEEIGVDEKWNF